MFVLYLFLYEKNSFAEVFTVGSDRCLKIILIGYKNN